MLTPTEALVDYAIREEYNRIPSEVVKFTKTCILDSLGCSLGGYQTRIGDIILRFVKGFGGRREATIFGDGGKIPSVHAAFANASFGNSLDFDDCFKDVGHTGSATIPAALAVGEYTEASGRDVIAAVVSGYEVATRIGEAMTPSIKRKLKVTFGGSSVQVFGAVTAAAKLLGLDFQKTQHAFGIAGAIAPLQSDAGWHNRPLHWVKETAFPAKAGTLAAFLASMGFVGNRRVLEGAGGFCLMFSDRCDFDKMTENLGKEYNILQNSFKPYSCCRRQHASLDAIKKILDDNNLRNEDIKEVVIKQTNIDHHRDYSPRYLVDAQFSLPYTVAMMIMGITPGPDWYAEETLTNYEVHAIMKKVTVETDPEADKIMAEEHKMVGKGIIYTKDGNRCEEFVEYPKGDPMNPLTDRELGEKFRHLASFALKQEQIGEIVRLLERLEKLDCVSELTNLLFS